MKDFHSLKVWQSAHELALAVYRSTGSFPREEIYGLTSQIRRAAVSIPANLAEGCGRDSQGELLRFTRIAMGSASELEYELFLAHDLKFLNDQEYSALAENVNHLRRMLNNFIQKLKEDDHG